MLVKLKSSYFYEHILVILQTKVSFTNFFRNNIIFIFCAKSLLSFIYIYWYKCVSDVIYEYTKSKLINEFLPHLQWTNYRIGAFLLLLHAEYLYLLIPTCLPTTWESNQPAWCHHTEPNSHLHHWPVPSCTPTCVNGACGPVGPTLSQKSSESHTVPTVILFSA